MLSEKHEGKIMVWVFTDRKLQNKNETIKHESKNCKNFMATAGYSSVNVVNTLVSSIR